MSQEIQKTTSQNLSIQSTGQNKLLGVWIRNDDERAVALTYSEKKIGDFTREDMTKLVEVMAQWRVLLGVTSEPTEHELIIICQFMYDNFKKYTLADVRLAMNWAISGRIEIGFVSQKNISSFYVSKAMNAYDEEKRQIFNRLMEQKESYMRQKEREEKPVEQTPLQKAETFKELIVSMYRSHESGSIFYDIGDFVYNWLKQTKQLNTTQEEIAKAVNYGKERYIEEKREKSLRQQLLETIDLADKEAKQKKYAREYMVRLYFETHSIGEIISKIKPSQFEKQKP